MKWSTAILAIYLLLLSFVPCADKDGCINHSAFANKQEPTDTEGKQDACTPFCICSSCHNIISIPNAPFISFPSPVETITQPKIGYVETIIKDITIEFFQPPRPC